jgi:hypothetical protein
MNEIFCQKDVSGRNRNITRDMTLRSNSLFIQMKLLGNRTVELWRKPTAYGWRYCEVSNAGMLSRQSRRYCASALRPANSTEVSVVFINPRVNIAFVSKFHVAPYFSYSIHNVKLKFHLRVFFLLITFEPREGFWWNVLWTSRDTEEASVRIAGLWVYIRFSEISRIWKRSPDHYTGATGERYGDVQTCWSMSISSSSFHGIGSQACSVFTYSLNFSKVFLRPSIFLGYTVGSVSVLFHSCSIEMVYHVMSESFILFYTVHIFSSFPNLHSYARYGLV